MTHPTVPDWLITAAKNSTDPGLALGFAASGYVAGYNARTVPTPRRPTGTGWPQIGDTR